MYFPHGFWTSSNLKNQLLSFYTFNNCSNLGKDNASTYDLTTNGSINCVAGKIGNAAENNTVASSMTCVDSAGIFDMTTDKTISFWIRSSDASLTSNLVGKRTVATEYWVQLDINNIGFQLGTDGTSAFAASNVNITNDTWFFVTARHILNTKTIRIQVNNGSIFEDTYTGNPLTSGQDFEGVMYGLGNEYIIDSLGIWGRILTAQEIAFLYNNGNGREYPF